MKPILFKWFGLASTIVAVVCSQASAEPCEAPEPIAAYHCNGTVTINVANPGDYSYDWSDGMGNIFSNGASYTIPNTGGVTVDFNFAPNNAKKPSVTITNLQTASMLIVVRRKGTSCTASEYSNVWVGYQAPPSVSAGPNQQACANSSSFALTGGTPSGGTWTSTTAGAVSNNQFNPSAVSPGTYTVSYNYQDPTAGCFNSATKSVIINGIAPIATQNVCGSLRGFVLPAIEGATGTWSGSHIWDGVFNPYEAGPGNHTVSFSYTTSQGCTGTTSGTINVFADTPGAAPSLVSPTATSCGSGTLQFTVPNPGQTYDYFLWFGTNGLIRQSNGQPFTGNTLTTPILTATQEFYVQGVDEDCGTDLATATAYVIEKPAQPVAADVANCADGKAIITISNPNSSYTYIWADVNENPLPVNPNPVSETDIWYTTSSNSSVLNIKQIPGTSDRSVTVFASLSSAPWCKSQAQQIFIFYRTPPATSIGSNIPGEVCTSTPPFTLTGGSPSNGTWKIGTQVNTSFNAGSLGAGSHNVIYEVADEYGCTGGSLKQVTVSALSAPAPLTIRTAHGTPAAIVPANPGANKSYNWYASSSGGSAFTTADEWTSGAITENTTYYISLKDESLPSCESIGRAAVNVYPNYLPIVSAGTDQNLIVPQRNTVLNATYYDPDGSISNVFWNQVSGPSTSLGNNLTGSLSLTDLASGLYVFRFTAVDNYSFSGTDDVQVVVAYPENNYNHVVTETILIPGITTENALNNLSVDDKSKSIQYFDGLGRASQVIQWSASPGKDDVVQPTAYDNFGREAVKYLPYTATSSNGFFKPEALVPADYQNSNQAKFYTDENDFIARDPNPYGVTVFEASPLNRVLEQGAPGVAWQPDTDHTIRKEYLVNVANEVYKFNYSSDTNEISLTPNANYYMAGTLTCNKTIDEHNNDVLEYIDKQGRTICKKVKAPNNTYASTYYIYDDFGNLVVVLPPEAVSRINPN